MGINVGYVGLLEGAIVGEGDGSSVGDGVGSVWMVGKNVGSMIHDGSGWL